MPSCRDFVPNLGWHDTQGLVGSLGKTQPLMRCLASLAANLKQLNVCRCRLDQDPRNGDQLQKEKHKNHELPLGFCKNNIHFSWKRFCFEKLHLFETLEPRLGYCPRQSVITSLMIDHRNARKVMHSGNCTVGLWQRACGYDAQLVCCMRFVLV